LCQKYSRPSKGRKYYQYKHHRLYHRLSKKNSGQQQQEQQHCQKHGEINIKKQANIRVPRQFFKGYDRGSDVDVYHGEITKDDCGAW